MAHPHGDGPFEQEQYERLGGVFVPVNGGREVGCEEGCAPDDLVEDSLEDHGIPGTSDDLPYDYGVETAEPADLELLSIEHPNLGRGGVGRTGPADPDVDEPPLGRPEERELWRRQRGLVQESSDEAARWGGLEASDLRRIEDAVGEDAGEVLPDAPEGESATGAS